jgi:1,4-dihydroxy-2-naphthoyl-CoA hydrolase
MHTSENFNTIGARNLPGHLGIVITRVDGNEIRSELSVRPELMAPNGYLHAGSIVALADTSAGYGCVANLPAGATGFTTIELKSNHVGTAREGTIECVATPVHIGKTTQVWDAVVTHRETGKTLALFRCTQMVLYPKGGNP